MRNKIFALWISLAFTGAANAQHTKGLNDLSKIPVPQQHYQSEYTFDKPTDPASWTKQKPGLHVAFGSTDELYLRSEVPAVHPESTTWEATGWKGERLNTQVLVWSPDSIEQIRFKVSDLVAAGGKVISRDNIKLNMVRYVVSNFPYNASNFSCNAPTDSAWLMPDRFETFERFDLPGNSVRPVWIACEIPRTAKPGKYSGTIQINSSKENVTLKVSITVQEEVLPIPHDWKFRLDLWQNPWVVASYYQVKPWSAEHKALLKKHLKLYADAGGKYITTYTIHSPWSGNSYTIEETMIGWTKKTNGTWKFNYSIFDQYVELCIAAGIDKAITIYTPVPGGNRFRYMDEKSGNYIYEEWSPTSEQYKTFWNIFLDDLKVHLTRKGWLKKTYLGINESSLVETIAAAKVIKENSKEWKITYAGDWHPELTSILDDYSPIINSEPSPQELKERSAKGFTTTYYVCCTPAHPNNFVFSPPAEGRYISWYAAAYGYNGFLRWAYDAWPADPMRDARHTLWPSGDCFLVYPGGISCIRFEKLREGIVDYEKIHILRELASKSKDKKVVKLINDLEAHLATLTVERDNSRRDYNVEKIKDAVHKGNDIVRDLSSELGH
jgi:hypothetical protein